MKKKNEKRKSKKLLAVYITAGDPNLATTEKLVLELERQGVDLIELGVPFSDPLADGPTIQKASSRALARGITLPDIFGLTRRLRRKVTAPLYLMTYYNPVFRYGIKHFVADAAGAGVTGVIIPDLPPEEAGELIAAARPRKFYTVFLASPTSSAGRIKLIAKKSTGFIYYVSLTGVTGARRNLAPEIMQNVKKIKRATSKKVLVGFGVSTPAQARAVAREADGVIVGSAVIKIIEQNIGKKDLVRKVGMFVKKLEMAVHE